MSHKYNNNNANNNLHNKPYAKYQTQPYNNSNNHYGPSPPHAYSSKYDSYNNAYPMKKPYGYAPNNHHKPQFPTFSYRQGQYGGFDDGYKTYKYTKKNMGNDEKMMSSCSTGSSEEDNNKEKYERVKRYHKELDFVVYLNSAPVYDAEPTERDTEILMYTFIGKHSDKFVCSDLKTGPKAIAAEDVPLPSFLEESQ